MFKTFEGVMYNNGYAEIKIRTRKNECTVEYFKGGVLVATEEYDNYKSKIKELNKQYHIEEVTRL